MCSHQKSECNKWQTPPPTSFLSAFAALLVSQFSAGEIPYLNQSDFSEFLRGVLFKMSDIEESNKKKMMKGQLGRWKWEKGVVARGGPPKQIGKNESLFLFNCEIGECAKIDGGKMGITFYRLFN